MNKASFTLSVFLVLSLIGNSQNARLHEYRRHLEEQLIASEKPSEALTKKLSQYGMLMKRVDENGSLTPFYESLTMWTATNLSTSKRSASNANWSYVFPHKTPINDPGLDCIDISTTKGEGRVSALWSNPGNPNHLIAGANNGGIWETIDGGNTWHIISENINHPVSISKLHYLKLGTNHYRIFMCGEFASVFSEYVMDGRDPYLANRGSYSRIYYFDVFDGSSLHLTGVNEFDLASLIPANYLQNYHDGRLYDFYIDNDYLFVLVDWQIWVFELTPSYSIGQFVGAQTSSLLNLGIKNERKIRRVGSTSGSTYKFVISSPQKIFLSKMNIGISNVLFSHGVFDITPSTAANRSANSQSIPSGNVTQLFFDAAEPNYANSSNTSNIYCLVQYDGAWPHHYEFGLFDLSNEKWDVQKLNFHHFQEFAAYGSLEIIPNSNNALGHSVLFGAYNNHIIDPVLDVNNEYHSIKISDWIRDCPNDPAFLPYAHADTRDIVYSESASSTVFIAHDGGVSKIDMTSTPIGVETINGTGFEINEVYSFDIANLNGNPMVLAGLQDMSHTLYVTSKAFTPVKQELYNIDRGDGNASLIYSQDPLFLFMRVNTDLYARNFLGFESLADNNVEHKFLERSSGPWLHKTVQHNYTENKFYSLTNTLRELDISFSSGSNAITYAYQAATPPIPPNPPDLTPPLLDDQLTDLASAFDSERIYVSDIGISSNANANLFRSDHNGAAFSWVSLFPPVDKTITNIELDPLNSDNVYISIGGNSQGAKVYKSTDAGVTWSVFGSGLPNVPVVSLVYQRGSDEVLYAGTDLGVYYFEKTSLQWLPFNTNLPKAIITELKVDYCNQELYCSTFGRGIWKSPLAVNSNPNQYPEKIISHSTQWGQDRLVEGTVRIKSGVTLTIYNSTYYGQEIRMLPGTKFVVEKGGKLIIDGAHLFNECGQLWDGIFVEGDPTQIQANTSAHGIVELKGGAIIEDAAVGVQLGYGSSNALNGGLLIAENAEFINCELGIRFREYNLPNLSSISKCSFDWTADFFTDHSPYAHIELEEVDGVKILGNTFYNNGNLQNAYGIISLDAGYKVEPACSNTNIPCSEPDKIRNVFFGFDVGIKVNSLMSNQAPRIDQNIFWGNNTGIWFSGVTNGIATRNDIQVFSPGGTGIFIDGSTNYEIEENGFGTLTIDAINPPLHTYGIRVNNSGFGPNLIYNNTFESLHFSIEVTGNNGDVGSQEEPSFITGGLEIKCNTFQCYFCSHPQFSTQDIYAHGSGTTMDPFQGSFANPPTSLAGNRFQHYQGSCQHSTENIDVGNISTFMPNIKYYYAFSNSTQPQHNYRPECVSEWPPHLPEVERYQSVQIYNDHDLACPSDLSFELGGAEESLAQGQPINNAGRNGTSFNDAIKANSLLSKGQSSEWKRIIAQSISLSLLEDSLRKYLPFFSDDNLIYLINKSFVDDFDSRKLLKIIEESGIALNTRVKHSIKNPSTSGIFRQLKSSSKAENTSYHKTIGHLRDINSYSEWLRSKREYLRTNNLLTGQFDFLLDEYRGHKIQGGHDDGMELLLYREAHLMNSDLSLSYPPEFEPSIEGIGKLSVLSDGSLLDTSAIAECAHSTVSGNQYCRAWLSFQLKEEVYPERIQRNVENNNVIINDERILPFRVYPNPTRSHFNLDIEVDLLNSTLSGESGMFYSIHSSDGKKIQSNVPITEISTKIALNSLASGVYVVSLHSATQFFGKTNLVLLPNE